MHRVRIATNYEYLIKLLFIKLHDLIQSAFIMLHFRTNCEDWKIIVVCTPESSLLPISRLSTCVLL